MGFITGLGIEEAKLRVFREINDKIKSPTKNWRSNTCGIFIDLSMAYDKVDREKLYSVLSRKKIL